MGWWDDFEVPSDWYDSESQLWDALTHGTDAGGDAYLQELFDTAMFDPDVSREERAEAYAELNDYLWDAYGIDFEDTFDWEDYREWYDAQ